MKIIFATLIILILLVPVQAQEEGLVAEWHFDEGAGNVVKDSSGNGNDGIIYGATWVDGKFGKALSFDGVDDYLKITSNDFKLQPLSVGLWVKSAYGNRGVLIKFENGNAYYGWSINIDNGVAVFYLINNIGVPLATVTSNKIINDNKWHHIEVTDDGKILNLYVDGVLSGSSNSNTPQWESSMFTYFGAGRPEKQSFGWFIGVVDEIQIYNRALTAEEINEHYKQCPTMLTLIKTATPVSIRQFQETTVTISLENSGISDITDIEVMDSIHPSFERISGDIPNPERFNLIGQGETREIKYSIKAKESGTFNIDSAIVTYADNEGNIQEIASEPVSIKVIPSADSSTDSSSSSSSASVNLHGEKTDVVLGEDVLLKLSAVNIIGNPTMHVQVIIIPPSGWSVTSSEFAKSGAGQYTTTYELESGGGKDIEVRIVPNQIGDNFKVEGRIIYYFGDDVETREDHALNLPITVRAKPDDGQKPSTDSEESKTPGFEILIAAIGLLVTACLVRRK